MELPQEIAAAAGMDTVNVAEGRWEGRIAREEQGVGGFGYDPLFLPDEEPGKSVAQLSAERKDELSHRGKALAKLVPLLERLSRLETA